MPGLPDLPTLIAEVDSRAVGGGALDRIAAAERVADELNGLGTRLIGYFVEQARAEGVSWSEIGTHLGISRQAAQQRYAPPRFQLTVSDLVNAGALVRLTGRTRDALARAEGHAARLDNATVDPQHLLLAILDDTDTLAIQALDRLDVDRDALRAALTAAAAPSTSGAAGPLPLGAAARRVLETATTQALKLSHNYVGTEHLLLGLTHTQRDTVAQVLANHGATRDRTRDAVRDTLNAYLQGR
ncbi:Clp protease N-terminal domain-containing protein [Amycolatopsis sp. YIM 10]|uniref:Clp protease N-terminal domain-containing protein n=1 Tax=Amycolatopsis sp. YIM 10 TaxID=2653857 RepID=UPI0018846E6A|nr:Clp protease N-terminal domain-containing protein [Amycolatopsis sp. YIM 10]